MSWSSCRLQTPDCKPQTKEKGLHYLARLDLSGLSSLVPLHHSHSRLHLRAESIFTFRFKTKCGEGIYPLQSRANTTQEAPCILPDVDSPQNAGREIKGGLRSLVPPHHSHSRLYLCAVEIFKG